MDNYITIRFPSSCEILAVPQSGDSNESEEPDGKETCNPEAMMSALNSIVIGQTSAKKKLVASVMLHMLRAYKRFGQPLDHYEAPNFKSNLLLMGPTGCGKSLMVDTLADALSVPVVKIDATQITPSGYIGESIGESIKDKIDALSDRFTPAQLRFTIVFIDEIDKLTGAGTEASFYTRIQSSLLKLVEGTYLGDVGGRNKKSSKSGQSAALHTNYMLFIFAGNFETVREKRKKVKRNIGFTKELHETSDIDITEELIKFGMLGELVGRMSSIAELSELTREEYVAVVTDSKASPYLDIKETLSHAGIDIHLSTEQINSIVDKAIKQKTGLRSLGALITEVFEDTILNADYWKGEHEDRT